MINKKNQVQNNGSISEISDEELDACDLSNSERLYIMYEPCGGKFDLLSHKKMVNITSSTDIVWDNSYFRGTNYNILRIQCASNSNHNYFSKEVYVNETNNPEAKGGFEPDNKKKEIILKKMHMKNGNTVIPNYFCAGGINDFSTVEIAKNLSVDAIVLATDYHVGANAYNHNVKFIFRLFPEQIEFIKKYGFQYFKRERFVKKIKNQKSTIDTK